MVIDVENSKEQKSVRPLICPHSRFAHQSTGYRRSQVFDKRCADISKVGKQLAGFGYSTLRAHAKVSGLMPPPQKAKFVFHASVAK